jgi:hypothetical protein
MKPCDAILGAIAEGHTTKGSALREAYRVLSDAGNHTGQHDLNCSWSILAHEGRIAKTGRTWHVVESEVAR